MSNKKISDENSYPTLSRRGFLKASVAAAAAGAAPMFFVKNANAFVNEPKGATVTLGFNVPQTGAYADEGADELRAYKLAVKHLNGDGDGGMMNTMKPMSLKGNGILGKNCLLYTSPSPRDA